MAYVSESGARTAPKRRKVRRAKTSAENKATFKAIQKNLGVKPAKPAPARVVRSGDSPATRTADLKKANAYKQTKKYKGIVESVRPARKTADANVSDDLRRANAYKATPEYRKIYQDARASQVTKADRQRKSVLDLYRHESTREALKRLDAAGSAPSEQARRDVPRSDAEIKRFLATGERPTRGGADYNHDGRVTAEEAFKAQGTKGLANPNVRATVQKEEVTAGALKILDQTTRPIHAVAGAVDESLKGGSIGDVNRRALRGLQNKDKTLFSDVLKRAGASKGLAGAAGFVLDVGLDPTTYVTGGTGNLARKAARDEAKRISKRALANGMTREAADRLGARAGARAAARAPEGRGLTLRVAGREVPVVRRATGAAARQARRGGARAAQTRVGARVAAAGGGTKNIVRDVRPTLTPAGMKREEFATVHDAAASARGKAAAAQEHAQRLARAVQKHVPDSADQKLIIDAIERKRIGKLPERLRQPAIYVRSQLRGQRRQAVRAGVAVKSIERGRLPGEAKGYFPHALDDALRNGAGVDEAAKVAGVGRRTIKLASASKRGDRRPISAINAQTADKFSTDLPLVLANHTSQMGTATARAAFNRSLAKVGREIKVGKTTDGISIKDSEALYAIKGSDIKKVKPGDGRIDGARYYAINENLAERELATLQPIAEKTAVGRAFNKGNRGFKRLATLTPAFHIRNAIGDTQLAYLTQPGHRLAINSGQAAKVLAAQRREGKAIDALAFPKPSGKTIKVNGERVPVEKVLKGSRENAATQTGFIGRELNDLVGRDPTGAVKKVRRGSGSLQRTLQARENLMRVSTYKYGLDAGKTGAKAARVSRATHIDYGDLTDFERQARRLLPFYTFSARSIPLHAQKLITNPGKFAQYQKIREEGAKALGLSPGYEMDQAEFEQRMAAIPIGASKIISMGLPLPSALNELPTSKNVNAYATELGNFSMSMVTPLVKGMIELQTGKNTFSRTDIEPPNKTLVPAPSWAAALPKSARDALGVKMIRDRNTGKMVPGWPGKNNYKARLVLIGPLGQANTLLTKGTNPRGQVSGVEKTLSVTSGIKVDRVDASGTELSKLYEERTKLTKQQGDLKLTGRKTDAEGFFTPQYERGMDRVKELTARIDAINAKNGQVKEKDGKRRVKKSGSSGWGGSSSGGAPAWGGGSGSSSGPSGAAPSWGG